MSDSPSQRSRLKPKRTRPLLSRLQPLQDELFRSYISRTSAAASTKYLQLLKGLGYQIQTREPPWCGMELRTIEAEQLAILTRQTPAALLDLHLLPTPTADGNPPPHPTRYRACAECQIEDRGWRRWNADPLHVVCPIHHTLLWDEGPQQRSLTQNAIFKQHEPEEQWDWTEQQRTPDGDTIRLNSLQSALTTARYDYPDIDKLFTKLIIAYNRATIDNPTSSLLTQHTEHGWGILTEQNRSPIDAEQSQRLSTSESIWARVEDLVSIYHTAIPRIIAAAQGQPSGYNEMFDDLYELGPMKRISTRSADYIRHANIRPAPDAYPFRPTKRIPVAEAQWLYDETG